MMKSHGAPLAEPPRRAFTLIELLVVVSIIGILATIAVPNFLEAMIRSKVTRCRADMTSLGTAVQIYAVDHGDYPPRQNDPRPLDLNSYQGTCARSLTSPIQYITSYPTGPFGMLPGPSGPVPSIYIYIHVRGGLGEVYAGDSVTQLVPEMQDILRNWKSRGLEFVFLTYGPDGEPGEGKLFRWPTNTPVLPGQSLPTELIEYDPTNGTISIGIVSRGSDSQPAGR